MAITETRNLPAQFVTDLGEDLAKQITAQSGVPIVAPGKTGIAQLAGESADDFAKRQQAAQQFDIRQQNLAGLAPGVAGQDRLQGIAQGIAEQAAGVGTANQGLGTFKPFLDAAKTQTDEATRLAGVAEGQLGAADTDLSLSQGILAGTPLGATAFQQGVQDFMSPYQSQVIDATLSEFDRNQAIREQSIRDQQTALGALGSGRAGVQLAEFGTGAARERALLQANLLQQGFNQAQGARQQDISNRFGLGQAFAGTAGQRAGMAGATQGLGAFRSGLGGQQLGLGQAEQGILGSNIGRLGSLGALNQAQEQANLDASREAARQAAFLPQQQLDRFGAQVTGLMGGYPGQVQQSFVPNPSPLQSALGIGTTLAGLYMGRKEGGRIGYAEGSDKKEKLQGIMQMAEIDMLKDEYDQYVFDLQEQRPDATPMSFEEFRRMVLSEQG